MKEQATIFFSIPTEVQDIFTIPKSEVEIGVYSVEVDAVKMDAVVVDDFSANVKRERELREIEIRKATNRLLKDNPDLKEKLNLGDYLHIDGCWFVWDSGWVKLASESAPTRFEDVLPNALPEKEGAVEEKKQENDFHIAIVRASGPVRTGIIMHKGDCLCFDDRRFCFDGMKWTETTTEKAEEAKEKSEMPDKETDLANLVSDRIKNIVEERTGIPNNNMDLKTLLSCFIKAMIERNSNRISTIQFYLVPLAFEKYGEMTVQELRILTYRIAREVAIEKGVVFGHVLDILKDNGIDLWKIANEEQNA